MIEVELPDGTIVEFPEGTSQDVMRQALMKLTAKSPRDAMRERVAAAKAGTLELQPTSQARAEAANRQAETQMNDPGALATGLLAATQGATFNFGDEIAARLASLIPGGPSYEEGLATARQALSAGREARPGTAIASELGGAVVSGLGAAAAAPARAVQAFVGPAGMRTVPAIGRGLLAGAGVGAAEGALSGFGEGEGGADERASSAASGAAMGGAFGGLLGAVMPVVARGAENVIGRFRRSDIKSIADNLGISENAAKLIKSTFDQGGDIAQARAALQRAGDEGMLADAGYAAQALLDASATSGGRAGQVARSAIDYRMARTAQSVDATLDATLGQTPLGPMTALDDIARKTAPQRSLAYQQAYGSPIDYASQQGMAIETVLGKIEPDIAIKAIKEANAEMLSKGEVNQQIMAVLDDNGKLKFMQEMPNVRQLDEIKKALQRLAYDQNANPMTGKLTQTGQRYDRLAKELRDATEAAVPSYGDAVKIGGDKLSEERAFMLGRDLLRTGTEIEDVTRGLGKSPSVAELDAAKSGLRGYISKTLGDVRAVASDPNLDARQVIKAVQDMSSDNARAKIKSLLGKEADTLLAEIDKAAQSSIVRASMAANSRTAVRTAVQQSVKDITEPGAVGQLLQGEPIGTSKAIIQAITGQTKEYTAQQQQLIFEQVARALTEKKGASAQAALNYIEKAMKGQPLTEAQNQFLAQQIAGAMFAAGQPAARRAAEGNQQ